VFDLSISYIGLLRGNFVRRFVAVADRCLLGIPLLVSFVMLSFAMASAHATEVHVDHHHSPPEESFFVTHNDGEGYVLTLRWGPILLPPHVGHVMFPDKLVVLPMTGWITAFRSRFVTQTGDQIEATFLHHILLNDRSRRHWPCPTKEALIFAAGAEMRDVSLPSGYGYPISEGFPMRARLMLQNQSALTSPPLYFELQVEYQPANMGRVEKNLYPIYLSAVTPCGLEAYDLAPGLDSKKQEYAFPTDGRIVQLGGHLHEYGEKIVLENQTTGKDIIVLTQPPQANGHLSPLPLVNFDADQCRIRATERLSVLSIYNNSSGKFLPLSAMGILYVGFIPDDESAFERITRFPHWDRKTSKTEDTAHQ
jgi:hypothetical protein